MIVRGRGVANDGVTPRRTLLVARPVTRTWVVAPVNRGDLAAIYGDWSLNFPPSVTPDEPRSMLEKSTFYAKNARHPYKYQSGRNTQSRIFELSRNYPPEDDRDHDVSSEETLPSQISSEGARPGRAKRDSHAARRASILQSCPKTRPRANQGPRPRRHGPALRRHPRRVVGIKTARVAENLLRRRNATDASNTACTCITAPRLVNRVTGRYTRRSAGPTALCCTSLLKRAQRS